MGEMGAIWLYSVYFGMAIKFAAAPWNTCLTSGDSFALCTRGTKDKKKTRMQKEGSIIKFFEDFVSPVTKQVFGTTVYENISAPTQHSCPNWRG